MERISIGDFLNNFFGENLFFFLIFFGKILLKYFNLVREKKIIEIFLETHGFVHKGFWTEFQLGILKYIFFFFFGENFILFYFTKTLLKYFNLWSEGKKS